MSNQNEKSTKAVTWVTTPPLTVLNEDGLTDKTGKNRPFVSEFIPAGNFKDEVYIGVAPVVTPLPKEKTSK
jgi:hypothetical protein